MSYEIKYGTFEMPGWALDDKAIEDLKNFIGEKVWDALRGDAARVKTAEDWQSLNYAMGFCGVRGFPVHAFARRYCLTAYRAWMADGENSVATDEQGFKL